MAGIVPAEPTDLPALVTPDHPRRSVLADAIATGRCFVARADHRAVAHLVFGQPFFDHPFIETLNVAGPYRRQGHGRALLRHALAMHPGQRVFTSTNTSNAIMRGLLAAVGFIESGWIDNLDPGDPEIVYVHLP